MRGENSIKVREAKASDWAEPKQTVPVCRSARHGLAPCRGAAFFALACAAKISRAKWPTSYRIERVSHANYWMSHRVSGKCMWRWHRWHIPRRLGPARICPVVIATAYDSRTFRCDIRHLLLDFFSLANCLALTKKNLKQDFGLQGKTEAADYH